MTELKLVVPQSKWFAPRPILVSKRLGKTSGSMPSTGAPLSMLQDTAFSDVHSTCTRRLTQRVVSQDVQVGEVLYIALFNFRQSAPAWLVRRQPNLRPSASLSRFLVHVSLRMYPCGHKALDASDLLLRPSRGARWSRSIAVCAVLMVFSGMLLVSICVWNNINDSEPDHDNQVGSDLDKLSAK